MADKFGLGNEARPLKLGQSFINSKGPGLHTIRYDFKPLSIDANKIASVEVGNNQDVTVTVPHLDGADVPKTVFKGFQRPSQKECILIIDKVTGEITLEKLSSHIQVKKTRNESVKPRLPQGANREQSHVKMPQKMPKTSNRGRPQTRPPVGGQRTSSKIRLARGCSKLWRQMTSLPVCSPIQAGPNYSSPKRDHHTNIGAHPPSKLASMPMIAEDDLKNKTLNVPQVQNHLSSGQKPHDKSPSFVTESDLYIGEISDSSSSSSDSDSSSSSMGRPQTQPVVSGQRTSTFASSKNRVARGSPKPCRAMTTLPDRSPTEAVPNYSSPKRDRHSNIGAHPPSKLASMPMIGKDDLNNTTLNVPQVHNHLSSDQKPQKKSSSFVTESDFYTGKISDRSSSSMGGPQTRPVLNGQQTSSKTRVARVCSKPCRYITKLTVRSPIRASPNYSSRKRDRHPNIGAHPPSKLASMPMIAEDDLKNKTLNVPQVQNHLSSGQKPHDISPSFVTESDLYIGEISDSSSSSSDSDSSSSSMGRPQTQPVVSGQRTSTFASSKNRVARGSPKPCRAMTTLPDRSPTEAVPNYSSPKRDRHSNIGAHPPSKLASMPMIGKDDLNNTTLNVPQVHNHLSSDQKPQKKSSSFVTESDFYTGKISDRSSSSMGRPQTQPVVSGQRTSSKTRVAKGCPKPCRDMTTLSVRSPIQASSNYSSPKRDRHPNIGAHPPSKLASMPMIGKDDLNNTTLNEPQVHNHLSSGQKPQKKSSSFVTENDFYTGKISDRSSSSMGRPQTQPVVSGQRTSSKTRVAKGCPKPCRDMTTLSVRSPIQASSNNSSPKRDRHPNIGAHPPSLLPSMPMIGEDDYKNTTLNVPQVHNHLPPSQKPQDKSPSFVTESDFYIGEISDSSSSSSDSDSSSSSSDSDSSSSSSDSDSSSSSMGRPQTRPVESGQRTSSKIRVARDCSKPYRAMTTLPVRSPIQASKSYSSPKRDRHPNIGAHPPSLLPNMPMIGEDGLKNSILNVPQVHNHLSSGQKPQDKSPSFVAESDFYTGKISNRSSSRLGRPHTRPVVSWQRTWSKTRVARGCPKPSRAMTTLPVRSPIQASRNYSSPKRDRHPNIGVHPPSLLPSMPMIGEDDYKNTTLNVPQVNNHLPSSQKPQDKSPSFVTESDFCIGEISDSSSSSSDSDSSSSGSDSDMDTYEVPL